MEQIERLLGQTDIYLLDQIMKGRYSPANVILDAGAGGGRNLHWFVQQNFRVYGTDRDPAAVAALRQNYPSIPVENFQVATVESLPFADAFFDHVISSAVLHFADSEPHFEQMFGEMIRVLKPGGSLFIRATTDEGLGSNLIDLGRGRFYLPDGTERFLLTRKMLAQLVLKHQLRLLEPFKTVLVEELRSMSVVVIGR